MSTGITTIYPSIENHSSLPEVLNKGGLRAIVISSLIFLTVYAWIDVITQLYKDWIFSYQDQGPNGQRQTKAAENYAMNYGGPDLPRRTEDVNGPGGYPNEVGPGGYPNEVGPGGYPNEVGSGGYPNEVGPGEYPLAVGPDSAFSLEQNSSLESGQLIEPFHVKPDMVAHANATHAHHFRPRRKPQSEGELSNYTSIRELNLKQKIGYAILLTVLTSIITYFLITWI